MFLLDTNVVSEVMRPTPDPRVVAWLDRQSVDTLFLSAISLAELQLGVAVLPDGRRKQHLQSVLEQGLRAMIGDRLLPFDAAAALAYAEVISSARRKGLAIGVPDGMIAAIAVAKGLTVATRDVGPFEAAGVGVVDPWGF